MFWWRYYNLVGRDPIRFLWVIEMKEVYNIGIEEWVEARVWQNGILKETHIFKGNTVTATGKQELAQLVGGLDTKTIDVIWAKIDGAMTPKTSTNSVTAGVTLNVETSSAYTTAGDYTAIFTGNTSLGTINHYNSIAITFTLPADSEVDFTVKWVFSGGALNAPNVCAARLGKAGGQYDHEVGTIEIWEDGGGSPEQIKDVTNAVSNNTLNVTHSSAFAGAESINSVYYSLENSTEDFESFTGFTIDVGAGQDFYFEADFIFG